jgi:hypothetical protein
VTMSTELRQLGDALERTIAAERAHRRPRPSRRLALAIALIAIAIPAAAVGAARLIGGEDVAHSMPLGAAIFAGTHATCAAVVAGVEYHCVLDKPPFPEVQDFNGVKEAMVDATKHVNGGCIGQSASGLVWTCYLGAAAVKHDIVSASFLGEYAPSPGHG